VRTKNRCGFTISKTESGGICFLILAYIRPEIYFAGTGFEYTSFFIVMPSPAGTIAGRIKPTLVTGHYQSFVSRIALSAREQAYQQDT